MIDVYGCGVVLTMCYLLCTSLGKNINKYDVAWFLFCSFLWPIVAVVFIGGAIMCGIAFVIDWLEKREISLDKPCEPGIMDEDDDEPLCGCKK